MQAPVESISSHAGPAEMEKKPGTTSKGIEQNENVAEEREDQTTSTQTRTAAEKRFARLKEARLRGQSKPRTMETQERTSASAMVLAAVDHGMKRSQTGQISVMRLDGPVPTPARAAIELDAEWQYQTAPSMVTMDGPTEKTALISTAASELEIEDDPQSTCEYLQESCSVM